MHSRLLRMVGLFVFRITINRNRALSTWYIDSPKTGLCENKDSTTYTSIGKTKLQLEVHIKDFFCFFLLQIAKAKTAISPIVQGK